jgi:DNA primase
LRVNPGKNVWYCDPCGVGGDSIAFLMRVQGLGFAEAVRELAL